MTDLCCIPTVQSAEPALARMTWAVCGSLRDRAKSTPESHKHSALLVWIASENEETDVRSYVQYSS